MHWVFFVNFKIEFSSAKLLCIGTFLCQFSITTAICFVHKNNSFQVFGFLSLVFLGFYMFISHVLKYTRYAAQQIEKKMVLGVKVVPHKEVCTGAI